MNRRDFIAIATAVPFGSIAFGKPVAHHTELHPHRLFLPGSAWGILAFVGQRTNDFMFFNGVVTDREATKLSKAINKEWRGLPQWFQFYLGIDPNAASKHWLMGDGWQRRVRIAEAYFRTSGGFGIEPQSDGVLLVRRDDSMKRSNRYRKRRKSK